MKYGHVSSYNILQIDCVRTLIKHLERCHNVSENRMNSNFSTNTTGRCIICNCCNFCCCCYCFVCFFVFDKDANLHAMSSVIIAAGQAQRTSGSMAIWSACILAAMSNLSADWLWTCPCFTQTSDVHSFSVRIDPKYSLIKNYFDWNINT